MMNSVKIRASDWGPLVCQGLHELYKEKIGFNVAIYGSDGGILDAHACILMAVSPTLKTWLAGDPIQNCHSVEIDSITCDIWTLLLDFIYTGALETERDNIAEILAAAEKLQMQPLMKACEEALCISKMAKSNTDLYYMNQKNKADVHLSLKSSRNHTDMLQKSIRSTITPIQHGYATAAEAKLRHSTELPHVNDLPPLISQDPSPIKEEKLTTPIKQEILETKKADTDSDAPLDLTKDLNRSNTTPSDLITKRHESSIPLTSQSQISPSNQSNGTPLGTSTPGANGGAADPQMQAVMAVYYNQMLQYSMLAQKMQQQQGGSGNGSRSFGTANSGLLTPTTMPPGLMQPLLGNSPFLTAQSAQALSDEASGDGRQRKFPCSICGMLFFTRHVKEQHELTHTNLKPYGCNICGFRARQKAVIWRHKKNRHPEADSSVSMDSLTLPPPRFGADDAEEDEGDTNDEEDLSLVIATENEEHAGNPGDMTSQYRKHSANSDNSVVPNEIRPSELQNTTSHSKLYGNTMCTPDRDGSSMTDIEEEVRNARKTDDGYLCRLCGRSLKSKKILQEHIMTHYNVRRYSCCYCNYRAKQRAGLYNHMKVKHKGMRPIWPARHVTARQSPFKLGSPSVKERLNRSFHERRQANSFHVGKVRKHVCRTCGKAFRMRSTLEKHELIHMNIKRYSCKYCGYKAKHKSLIVAHTEKKHESLRVRIADLYSNRCGSPHNDTQSTITSDSEGTPNVKDILTKPVPNSKPFSAVNQYSAPTSSSGGIPRPTAFGATMHSPPQISREPGQIFPHEAHPYLSSSAAAMSGMGQGDLEGSKMTLLNGNVGILQLEVPQSQREALEGAKANFSSYGTPDKPHRCKTCGRCFRLRHVMEQHELTHFNFRKYMCDICGFRAKQKAVIYRHKKVKHPNHPGAGRVTLVPEYGSPLGAPGFLVSSASATPTQQLTSGLISSSLAMPQQSPFNLGLGSQMKPMLIQPSLTDSNRSPVSSVLKASPYKLSPSNNPDLLHNNNKRSPLTQHPMEAVQDLSLTAKPKREPAEPEVKEDGVMDMRTSPAKLPQNSALKTSPFLPASLPNSLNPSWYNSALQQRALGLLSNNNSNNKVGDNGRMDEDDDDDSSSLKSGENLTRNMALGLPSMAAPSPQASSPFMSLPHIAPLSPEGSSNGPASAGSSPSLNGLSPGLGMMGAGMTPDKKYTCQVCKRSFKHRHVLEQHYITHTGLRPYKCEFCDFCARQKASLWRHKQKHLNHQQQLA